MKVKPLPGNMIVELESLYKDTGLIKIPVRYKQTPHIVGRIKEISMRPIDIKTLGHEIEAGTRVIISHLGGRHLSANEYIFPITAKRKDVKGRKYQDSIILAIVPDTVELSNHIQDVERCQFCGEAKPGAKQNIILVDGVCPRCGRNRNGEIPSNEVTVSDAEVEEFYDTQLRAAAG
jgi:hypothetical protein